MIQIILALVAMAWVWHAAPATAAEGYITGIKTGVEQLALSEEAGKPAKYFLATDDFVGPIPISDSQGDDWLEIVVNDEYYWIAKRDVIISRPRTASSGAMASAATAGARLHLRSN